MCSGTNIPRFWIKETLRNRRTCMGRTKTLPCIGAVAYINGVLKSSFDPNDQSSALLRLLRSEQNIENCNVATPIEPFSFETRDLLSLLVRKHIKAVLFASLHPNKKERGLVFDAIKASGIAVYDLHRDVEVSEIDRRFWTWASKGRSYIHLKISLTADGQVVPTPGQKTRLAGKLSSERIHRIRGIYDGLLLGGNTVRKDGAQMTYRGKEDLPQPMKIILSHSGEFDQCLPAFQGNKPYIYAENNLTELAKKLAHKNITSVLVEGGWQVYKEFIEQGVMDEVSLVWTNKLGRKEGLPLVGNLPYGILKVIGEDIWEIIEWPVARAGRHCRKRSFYETN